MTLAYAIDFGTTNSLLASASTQGAGEPIPIDPFSTDPTIMRTILFTPRKDQWHFGEEAIQSYSKQLAEGRLFRSIKKYLPIKSFSGTSVHNKNYTLHDLISIFLSAMRERANEHFQDDISKVVLGRPAAFSLDPDKDKLAENRLRAAAMQAGFKDIEFCPEPIAAAYEFRHSLDKPKTVLIADFGGGTSDFTVMNMKKDSFDSKDVLAVAGIPIAGDMFDGSIMKHMICPHFGSQVKYKLPMGNVPLSLPKHLINRMCSPADISFLGKRDIMSLLKDAQKWALSTEDSTKMNNLFVLIEELLGFKLFNSIEKSKRLLSDSEITQFCFDHNEVFIEESVKRSEFQSASQTHVDSITTTLDEVIKTAGLTNSEIDIVCCTGGTAKIPAIHTALSDRFGADKLQQHKHFHSVIGGLAERAFECFR